MKIKLNIRPDLSRTMKQLSADYKRIYRTDIPDSVFQEMVISLGLDCLQSMLKYKADSMKMEV